MHPYPQDKHSSRRFTAKTLRCVMRLSRYIYLMVGPYNINSVCPDNSTKILRYALIVINPGVSLLPCHVTSHQHRPTANLL